MRLVAGLCLDPLAGGASALPHTLSRNWGVPTSKAGGKKRRNGKEGDGEGKARKGKAG